MAVFVTFEGPEGAGKSTAIQSVAEGLADLGLEIVKTREPGAGEVGQAIRRILLHGETLDPKCELFLFLADRAQHVATVILPALERGAIVLCDRYGDSTVVYQGVARGIDQGEARRLNAWATGGLEPALTLLLDVTPEIGLRRVTDQDRLDREPIEFHRAVRNGFLDLAQDDPDRWVVVDASNSAGEVAASCLKEIRSRLTSAQTRT